MASKSTSKADAAAAAAAGAAWEQMGQRLKELATAVNQLSQHLSNAWQCSAAEAAIDVLKKLVSSADAAATAFTDIGHAVASQSGSLSSELAFFEETSQQVKTELANAIKAATVTLSKVPGGTEIDALLVEAAQRLASLPQ